MQNLVGVDLAIAVLHRRVNRVFVWICLFIYLSVSSSRLQVTVEVTGDGF